MIAVISGSGNLPLQACKNLLAGNKKFFVISLFPQNNGVALKEICTNKADVFIEKCYKAGNILKLLKRKNTKKVLFIGKVDKSTLLKNIKFDWLAIKMLASMACKSDKTIMEKLLSVLKKEGIEVIKQNNILNPLMIKPGLLAGKITDKIEEDIQFGMKVAQDISRCDVGQTVVVKDKMVIAIEAIEGTDNCIKRGIKLGKNNLVICKAAHDHQNTKYDLPTLGPNSLKGLKKGQIKAIAWKSSHTFISEKETFIKKAKELDITLIGI